MNERPYEELIYGGGGLMHDRIKYAYERGYRIEAQPDGFIKISETDEAFAARQENQIYFTPESVLAATRAPT